MRACVQRVCQASVTVEGEVVAADDLTVRWTEVDGASSYQVTVSYLGDGPGWTGDAQGDRLDVPDEAELVTGADYRVELSSVPDDLLPPGEVSSRFRTGSPLEVIGHRVRRARPVGYALVLSGLVLAGAFLANRRIFS